MFRFILLISILALGACIDVYDSSIDVNSPLCYQDVWGQTNCPEF